MEHSGESVCLWGLGKLSEGLERWAGISQVVSEGRYSWQSEHSACTIKG